MARPITRFILPAADQAALKDFTRMGCRPVRAVRRAQALLALATGIGQQAAGQAAGLSRQTVSQVRQRYAEGGAYKPPWPKRHAAAVPSASTGRNARP